MPHNAEMIREYVDDYVKFFPEKWSWGLRNSREQNELYRRTRARRAGYRGENNDLLPDFYSIERDADQFELSQIEWTDFFGLVWEGKKGVLARVGAPNYQGNLYYYMDDDSFAEPRYFVSDEYDAYNNQPPSEVYTRFSWNGINHWIDTANTCSVKLSITPQKEDWGKYEYANALRVNASDVNAAEQIASVTKNAYASINETIEGKK